MIVIDICLSDIPKDKITTSEKNGKKYAKFIVDDRKEKGNYGETHSVAMNQTKEERDAKEKKIYVGNGKEFIFNNQQQTKKPDYVQLPDDDGSDLPF